MLNNATAAAAVTVLKIRIIPATKITIAKHMGKKTVKHLSEYIRKKIIKQHKFIYSKQWQESNVERIRFKKDRISNADLTMKCLFNDSMSPACS